MKHSLFLRVSIVATLAAMGTAACQNAADDTGGNAQVMAALPDLPATLPLETGEASDPAYAPNASDLPDVPTLGRARIANDDEAYGYADAAYSYSEALGDAPPDYGFDYDGVEPWAWQGNDDSLMFAEPIDDGYRQYYYRPGAAEPYFIRDPYYSYGFAGGLLAVIYAADGGIVPFADYGPRYAYASRYFARGRTLYGASRRGRRQPVIVANWVRRSPALFASRQRWGAGRAHQPAWNAYYQANRPRQANYWRAETVRRQADTRRLAAWRDGGFRSAAPPRAIPAAWTNAKWARDDRRYRPAADDRGRGRDAAGNNGRADARNNGRNDPRADARNDRADRGADRNEARDGADRDRQARDRAQAERQRPERQQAERQQGQQREREQAERQRDRAQAERQRERDQADRRGAADRPREQGRTERPDRVDRQDRPERPQRVERQDRPQRAERPDRPERQDRPDRRDNDAAQARQQQQAQQRAQREREQGQQQNQQRQQQQAAQRDQAQRAQREQAQRAQREQAQQAQQAQRAQQQQQRQAQQQQEQRQQQQAQRQQQQSQAQEARQQQRQQQQEQRQQRPRRDRDE